MIDLEARKRSINPVYRTWSDIKERCNNPSRSDYKHYGGRGIKLCSRWDSYDNFSDDMKMYWKPGLEIDRIDSNGDYSPSNCRWVTRSENNQNKGKRPDGKKYSGYIGVSFNLKVGKWTPQIQKDKEKIHLGYFEKEKEAAEAYDKKAVELFGPYASINFPLIRLRNDDILMEGSSGWGDKLFDRFKQVHRWTLETHKVIHVPAILMEEIQAWPECIEFIKDETKKGNMILETHGHRHVDYGKLSKQEIKDNLMRCKEFMWETFEVQIRHFMSPWGAWNETIKEASEEVGLKLVGAKNETVLEGQFGVLRRLKDGEPLSTFYGERILTHFWQRGLRIFRLCQVYKYGSWNEAAKANPKEF